MICSLSITCPSRVAGRNFHLRAASSDALRNNTEPSIALVWITEPSASIVTRTKTLAPEFDPRAAKGNSGCTLRIACAGMKPVARGSDLINGGFARDLQLIAKLVGRRFSSLRRTRTTIEVQL